MFYEQFILFFSSLISATLLPGGSELLLIYYLQASPEFAGGYLLSATLGNSLGSLISYFMGYYFYWGRENTHSKHQKAWHFCSRYGSPVLLLSWLPIVGDLLPLVAGWLKLPIKSSIIFIVLGKASRYLVIVISTLYLL